MPERIMPSRSELEKMLRDGLSAREIAAEVERKTGRRPSIQTVTSTLSREGLTKPRPRYHDEIPWRVKAKHLQAYPVRMLRLLGRRRRGAALTETQEKNLDGWLAWLEQEKAVVGYDPNSVEGFFYVDRRGSEGRNGIPIRRKTIDSFALRAAAANN